MKPRASIPAMRSSRPGSAAAIRSTDAAKHGRRAAGW
jgi:hypothetical protein